MPCFRSYTIICWIDLRLYMKHCHRGHWALSYSEKVRIVADLPACLQHHHQHWHWHRHWHWHWHWHLHYIYKLTECPVVLLNAIFHFLMLSYEPTDLSLYPQRCYATKLSFQFDLFPFSKFYRKHWKGWDGENSFFGGEALSRHRLIST